MQNGIGHWLSTQHWNAQKMPTSTLLLPTQFESSLLASMLRCVSCTGYVAPKGRFDKPPVECWVPTHRLSHALDGGLVWLGGRLDVFVIGGRGAWPPVLRTVT